MANVPNNPTGRYCDCMQAPSLHQYSAGFCLVHGEPDGDACTADGIADGDTEMVEMVGIRTDDAAGWVLGVLAEVLADWHPGPDAPSLAWRVYVGADGASVQHIDPPGDYWQG